MIAETVSRTSSPVSPGRPIITCMPVSKPSAFMSLTALQASSLLWPLESRARMRSLKVGAPSSIVRTRSFRSPMASLADGSRSGGYAQVGDFLFVRLKQIEETLQGFRRQPQGVAAVKRHFNRGLEGREQRADALLQPALSRNVGDEMLIAVRASLSAAKVGQEHRDDHNISICFSRSVAALCSASRLLLPTPFALRSLHVHEMLKPSFAFLVRRTWENAPFFLRILLKDILRVLFLQFFLVKIGPKQSFDDP